MAVLMENVVEQGTTDFYDAVNEKLGVDENPPAGMVVHIAMARDGGGIRIVDVWESREAFESFRDDRLMPTIQAVAEENNIPMEWPPTHEFT